MTTKSGHRTFIYEVFFQGRTTDEILNIPIINNVLKHYENKVKPIKSNTNIDYEIDLGKVIIRNFFLVLMDDSKKHDKNTLIDFLEKSKNVNFQDIDVATNFLDIPSDIIIKNKDYFIDFKDEGEKCGKIISEKNGTDYEIEKLVGAQILGYQKVFESIKEEFISFLNDKINKFSQLEEQDKGTMSKNTDTNKNVDKKKIINKRKQERQNKKKNRKK